MAECMKGNGRMVNKTDMGGTSTKRRRRYSDFGLKEKGIDGLIARSLKGLGKMVDLSSLFSNNKK
jgi:hypothetical protein